MVVALTSGVGGAVTLGLAVYGWRLLEEIDRIDRRILVRAAAARSRPTSRAARSITG